MRIGIICPSEIALRRFMPALQRINNLEFIGLAVSSAKERFGENLPDEGVVQRILKEEYDKAKVFIQQYGGKIFNSYDEIVRTKEIDAIYIPLPPALHFKWAKRALELGKHVLVEKPATITVEECRELIKVAQENNLALHENYMFAFHNQLDAIDKIVDSGELGDIRLLRISFGFPKRPLGDFRYNKALGGGALIDAGGYTIKYATRLLGRTAKIHCAYSNYIPEFEVDIYGSATLINEEGLTAQISFGMDNSYKCELEIWGSDGFLSTGRVLTAPADFVPQVKIQKGQEEDVRNLPSDDTFMKSILYFLECTNDKTIRENSYNAILEQAQLVDEFRRKARCKNCDEI